MNQRTTFAILASLGLAAVAEAIAIGGGETKKLAPAEEVVVKRCWPTILRTLAVPEGGTSTIVFLSIYLSCVCIYKHEYGIVTEARPAETTHPVFESTQLLAIPNYNTLLISNAC